tara:strand:- start:179 stop:1459 length:1281 start_codon:yes stop_codon:yes gene_type:complete
VNWPKDIAVGLLSLLLFLSLSTLGLVFTVNNTVLSADFVASQLNNLDMLSLADEVDEALIREIAEEITIVAQMPEKAKDQEIKALVERTQDALAKFEPQIEEEISNAIHPIYDYLLGESPNLDLKDTLYNTVLSTDLTVSIVKKVDLYFLVEYFVIQEVTEEISGGMTFLTEYVEDVVIKLEPWIRSEMDDIIAPITDYILGKSQGLDIVISIEKLKESPDLYDALWEALRKSPPTELADLGLNESELQQIFDLFYEDFVRLIPSTFEINENLLGPGMSAQITQALADADKALENEQIRNYIAYPQTVFTISIIILLLSLAGIILINRRVRGVSRWLGSTFLTCGVFELVSVFIIKNQLQMQIAAVDMPSPIRIWLEQLASNSIAPLQTFSIVLIVLGAGFQIFSFIYRQNQPTSEPESESSSFTV